MNEAIEIYNNNNMVKVIYKQPNKHGFFVGIFVVGKGFIFSSIFQ